MRVALALSVAVFSTMIFLTVAASAIEIPSRGISTAPAAQNVTADREKLARTPGAVHARGKAGSQQDVSLSDTVQTGQAQAKRTHVPIRAKQ